MQNYLKNIRDLLQFNVSLLKFSLQHEQLTEFTKQHLYFGLFCTWVVGMGRWWDDPKANILQNLGLGSIIYVFVLALLIYLLVLPLKPFNWSYRNVLTFVSLTSMPAILYAIPVERFVSMEAAIKINIAFLGIVALWRVGLYFYYLNTGARLSGFAVLVVGLLPLCAIVTALVFLNLHNYVFEIMGGLRETDNMQHSGEYLILNLLTGLSVLMFIPLVLSYVFCIYRVRNRG